MFVCSRAKKKMVSTPKAKPKVRYIYKDMAIYYYAYDMIAYYFVCICVNAALECSKEKND